MSAFAVLEQSPPPSLREILAAYRAKGDGDRDMLLAMLNAKAAEDQRLASVAALHRSVLEAYNGYSSRPASPLPPPHVALDGYHHYPTPTYSQSPQSVKHRYPYHYSDSTSRSPPPHHHTHLPPLRDALYSEPPRKRHCSSHSPASSYHDQPPPQHNEQLPPSPYSSSERSESGDYSPRARGSMAIGSLLSSRPNQQLNGDES